MSSSGEALAALDGEDEPGEDDPVELEPLPRGTAEPGRRGGVGGARQRPRQQRARCAAVAGRGELGSRRQLADEGRLVRCARDVVAAVDADVDRLERRGQADVTPSLTPETTMLSIRTRGSPAGGRRSGRRGLRASLARRAEVDELRIVEPQEMRVAGPGGDRGDQARDDDRREQSQTFPHVCFLLVCPAETRSPRTHTISSFCRSDNGS